MWKNALIFSTYAHTTFGANDVCASLQPGDRIKVTGSTHNGVTGRVARLTPFYVFYHPTVPTPDGRPLRSAKYNVSRVSPTCPVSPDPIRQSTSLDVQVSVLADLLVDRLHLSSPSTRAAVLHRLQVELSTDGEEAG